MWRRKKLKGLSSSILIAQVDISILQSVEYQNSKTCKISTGECSRDLTWIPQIYVSSWNPLLDFSRKLYLSPCIIANLIFTNVSKTQNNVSWMYDPLPYLLLIKYKLMQNSYLEHKGDLISTYSTFKFFDFLYFSI